MANGNGIEINTPWVTLQGTGLVVIMLFLTVVMLGFSAYASYLTTLEHRALVNGLNDVFIAVMTPADAKANLPPMLKDKLQEKMTEKTREKVNSPAP
jgi:hypothetical protein